MKRVPIVVGALGAVLISTTPLAAQPGVTEINEGTVRRTYVSAPLVGAKGYVVGDWVKGEARIEVLDFPASETGYEVFLFQMDAPAYMEMMFVDGDPQKGIVENPPPFDEVGGLISQWYSLGDLEIAENGQGSLEYKEGKNIVETGLNMIMVFEKVTPGRHDGPEDMAKLMVECNGPLMGIPGAESMARAIKVF